MSEDEHVDAYGFWGPLPTSMGQRYIAPEGFSPGIAVGEPAPNFTLVNQSGQEVDFHADRDGSKAALLFFRSAVW